MNEEPRRRFVDDHPTDPTPELPKRKRRSERYASLAEEQVEEQEQRWPFEPQPDEDEDEDEVERRTPRWWTILLAILLILALIAGGWYVSQNWNRWFNRSTIAPVTIIESTDAPPTTAPAVGLMNAPATVPIEEPTKAPTKAPTTEPTEVPTMEPTRAPTKAPMVKPTEAPTMEPTKASVKVLTVELTEAPTKELAVEPTEVPVEALAEKPTKEPKKEQTTDSTMEPTKAPKKESGKKQETVKQDTVTFNLTGETSSFKLCENGGSTTVVLKKFERTGGWITDSDDPWFLAEKLSLEKEVPEAFGKEISGEAWSDRIDNWLKAATSDPWTLTWFRFQMDLEVFRDMEEANKYAESVAGLSADEYDSFANETLAYFFGKIDGGEVKISPYWSLEVMMRWKDTERTVPELFSRKYGDTNHTPDTLITFYSADKKNFVSSRKAFEVACKFARVSTNDYGVLAWINLKEAGTWKWKGGETISPTPPPPSPTPSPSPSPTPTSSPTPTPRPTKDPSVRPTPTTGGGTTDPDHSTDPQTTANPTSTPKPSKPTPTPKPTAKPTAVPTAVVQPTEICPEAPTPIREDTTPAPSSKPGHNVPETETGGEADDSFDPDSV